MKKHLTFTLLITAGLAPAYAQWAVVDVPNLTQSVANYGALVQQIENQATQITNQVEQIRQFETQLKRMGDMSTVRNLAGFREFRVDLDLPSQAKRWSDGIAGVNGTGLFGDTRGGIFSEVNGYFADFDGARIDRDPRVFKQSHNIVVTVDQFKTVQNDVYTRRENLKSAIARTSEALQAASTEAEEQKLQAVLSAQYGQLSAVDAEVTLSAAQVQVKEAEATAMNNAQADADAEARRRLAQQEVTKLSSTFKPRYECLLQYVSERPLAPDL